MRTEELLATPVYSDGAERPFGELTVEAVEARAAELGGASHLGHRSRVGAVAAAWRQLAELMRAEGAGTVAALDSSEVEERAEKLWIVPPGGSLLP